MYYSCFCCRQTADIFLQILNKLFLKKIRNTIRESNGLIQIRTDVLSVLIWVQTICKGYQQTTKVAADKERVKLKPHGIHCIIRFSNKSYPNCIIIKHSFWSYFDSFINEYGVSGLIDDVLEMVYNDKKWKRYRIRKICPYNNIVLFMVKRGGWKLPIK